MLLKSVHDKGAVVAWSPLKHMPYAFASGTKEGGGGGFNDYGGELCIHQFGLAQTTTECRTIASVKTPARFSSVAWGARTARQSLPHGLIAGGMADGAVVLWDAGAVLAGGQDAVATISRHGSAVRALQFNPNPAAEHLLAAGSVDGDLSIINLDAPASPVLASPLPAGQRLESEITSLAWNTSVHHILATATVNGVVVVWDLKENRPWCHLRDPHRASISDLSWNPDDGLYLVTACDDDARPVLRVWDLRSSTTTPLCELSGGHTKGVLSVDWCPWDPNLLVTCGKDAHTFVWDIQQGRPIAEIPAAGGAGAVAAAGGGGGLSSSSPPVGGGYDVHGGAAAAPSSVFGAPPSGASSVFGGPSLGGGGGGGDPFSVFGSAGGGGGGSGATLGGLGASVGRRYLARWSKRAPGLVVSCSFDRCVTVHSVVAMGPGLAPKSTPAHIAGGPEATLRRAPRWLRRPVGASFSFGGKLVSFAAPIAAVKAELRVGPVQYAKRLQVSSVTTGHDFVSRALEFEGVLAGLEAGTVDPRAVCDAKAAGATTRGASEAASTWTFIRMLFEADARQRVLAYVGYDSAAIAAEMARYNQGRNQQGLPTTAGEGAGAASQAAAPEQQASPEAAGEPLLSQPQPVWGGGFHVPPDAASSVASASDLFGASSARADAQRPDDFFGAPPPSVPAEPAAAPPAVVPTPAAALPPGGASLQPSPPPTVDASADPLATYERRRVPSAADDRVLQRALLVGDFASAVAVSFEQGRFADALLLASCGSPEVWAAAKDEYFRRRAAPLTASISAIVRGDFASFVAAAPLSDWRDTVGLLCTYAKHDEFSALCEALGDRLASEAGDLHSACTVYMAALCTAKAIAIWVQEAERAGADGGGDEGLALHELVEKSCVLRHATYVTAGVPPMHGPQPEAAHLARYATALANEGFLPTAAFFAARVVDAEGDAAPAGASLRHRLARAFSHVDYAYPAAQALAHAPEPFAVANIGPAPLPQPSAAHTPQHQTGHAHHGGELSAAYGHGPHHHISPPGAFEGHAPGAAEQHYPTHHQQQYAPPAQPQPYGQAAQQQQQHQQPQQQYAPPAPVARPVVARAPAPPASYGGPAPVATHAALPAHPVPAQPLPAPGYRGGGGGVPSGGAPAGLVPAAPMPGAVSAPAPAAAAAAPQRAAPAVAAQSAFHGGFATQQFGAPVAALAPPPAAAPAPAPPAGPPAPLPISPEMLAALEALAGTAAALGALQLSAAEQRQLGDATKALGTIQSKLQEGRMSGDAAAKLCTLAAQCAAYDFHGAQRTQTELASVDWAQTKDWLRGVRGMVSLALIKSAAGAGR